MLKPTMLVFAGPNGSGKSTIVSVYSQEYPSAMVHYVNADEIQRHLSCDPLTAAQIAESTREKLLEDNCDFAFETVLSTDRNYLLMKKAREKGYRIICIYVLTKDPEINVERVKARMRAGENACGAA